MVAGNSIRAPKVWPAGGLGSRILHVGLSMRAKGRGGFNPDQLVALFIVSCHVI